MDVVEDIRRLGVTDEDAKLFENKTLNLRLKRVTVFSVCERLIIYSCCFGVRSHSNIEYHFVNQTMTWTESYCRTYHTDLTSIRSKEEKSNITLTLNGSGVQYVWIGLYRDPWAFWSDNTTSTFTNWMSYPYKQPNNYYPPEDCGAFSLMTGEWGDGSCTYRGETCQPSPCR
uniref:C-type lectin domain-containing protein n=1 Tax=Oreochromis niloticus TaxID=8128 RepID=A0A669EDQ2_ORENI